jgi:hypothetical protein
MGRVSSVKRLPPEIRETIADLRAKSITIDQILGKLRELGGEAGEISRSSLGRYVKQLDVVGERIRRSREVADALVKRLGDAPESRQARLNIELMHTLILDLVTGGEDGAEVTLDPEQAMFLGRALRDISTAQKIDADYTLRVRNELIAEQQKKLKKLEGEAGKAGAGARALDSETLRRVREEIYGIREASPS